MAETVHKNSRLYGQNLTYSTYYPPNARQTYSGNKNFIQRFLIENDPSKRNSGEVECVRIGAHRIL